MVADMQQRRKKGDKNIQKLQKILIGAARGGTQQPLQGDAGAAGTDMLLETKANEAFLLLGSDQFRLWPDDVRKLLAAYEADGNARRLAKEILQFGKRFEPRDGANGDSGGGGARVGSGRDGSANLVLIGAQFVMDEYNPGLGRRGLDRHSD